MHARNTDLETYPQLHVESKWKIIGHRTLQGETRNGQANDCKMVGALITLNPRQSSFEDLGSFLVPAQNVDDGNH